MWRCCASQRPSAAQSEKEFAIPAVRAGFLDFPDDFVVGVGTSAYQIEGAALEYGRKASICDTWAHTPGKVEEDHTGDIACDHYHRFVADVAILAHLGLKAYRFSISWSRLIPDGEGDVNPAGAKFYSDLIDTLLQNGVTPYVTLYHFDLPQALQDEFGGWIGPKERITRAFAEYARTCFELYGDRVKNWVTLNEPWSQAILGYQFGVLPPGQSKAQFEMYTAAHNFLLSHAEAVRIFRQEFQEKTGGVIGITLCMNWMWPMTPGSPEHNEAAQRRLAFMFGWFADPIFFGDYPDSMRETVQDRLPHFTEEEKDLLAGSADFIGLNYYSTQLCVSTASIAEQYRESIGGYAADVAVHMVPDEDWESTGMGWSIVPSGLREMLLYIQKVYAPLQGIYVTECGAVLEPDSSSEVDWLNADALVPQPYCCDHAAPEDYSLMMMDYERVRFLRAHLAATHAAVYRGADVKGFFAWSFLDNFEWGQGYKKRFGVVRVDFASQRRTIKASAHFLAQVARENGLEAPPFAEQYRGRNV